QPALARTLRIAGIGAVVNQAGSCEWVACALISARIGRPSRSARERRVRINAAAPSALAHELAAVIVPSARKAGFSAAIFSGETLSGFSSWAITLSPPLAGAEIGAISAANA